VKKRAAHAAELLPRLHAALADRSAHEWEAWFGDEVPCATARNIADMFDHPQVQAEAMVTEFDHPVAGRYRGLARPIKFSRTPGPAPFSAPTLGQHTGQVLARKSGGVGKS
jgi:formyl-CoA transferase